MVLGVRILKHFRVSKITKITMHGVLAVPKLS